MTPVRLPAEWEPQRSVWLIWPGNPTTWPQHRKQVQVDHAFLVSVCARFQSVDLICCSAWRSECERFLQAAQANFEKITFHDWPVNDAWIRDTGPVFLRGDQGLQAVDLPFNAWGGKFAEWTEDDQIARRVSEHRKIPYRRFPMFGEGGGLESNGEGTLLVTESVWMNPNRNPGLSKKEIEDAFRTYLGAGKIIWLKAGMSSDDTDGHVDTLARFVRPNTVILPSPHPQDPDSAQLFENRQRLGKRFQVIELPHPNLPNQPASYLNAVFVNGAVLVPAYGVEEDQEALAGYRSTFPDRECIGVPSSTFLKESGALHCLTLNEWA